MKSAWLELFDWEFVTATNAALCQPKKALHKPTFAAIARSLVDTLKLKADQAHVIRSLLGHVVAGTASDVEAKELREFSRSLTAERLKTR